MSLAEIQDYSEAQIAEAVAAMPALSRYLDLLDKSGCKDKPVVFQLQQLQSDLSASNFDTELQKTELNVTAATMRAYASDEDFLAQFSVQLRLYRHQAWVRCALAEYFQRASTQEICLYWSTVADDLVRMVYHVFAPENLAIFAYGKWGASELNLSSDIDLVLVAAQEHKDNVIFVRKLQMFLQQITDVGFCFRLDFDLRPGGRMGQLVPTVEQFVDYYGNYGEAWERLAFVRLRCVVGASHVADKIYDFVNRFSYRKHLDYSLLSDLKILRQRIHSHYNVHTMQIKGDQVVDLKLGIGGIRDLELFVHTLQVIHGGKDLSLRQRQTADALRKLEDQSVLPAGDVQFLLQHYWHLRHLENLAQAYDDQQTHVIVDPSSLFEKKIFFGLVSEMQHCDNLVSELLGKVDASAKSVPDDFEHQQLWLAQLGYSPRSCQETWPEIIKATALSRQKERDEYLRKRFLFVIVEKLAQFRQTQDLALGILADFLKATRAKATFFSLLLSHENLIDQVAKIFATSPYLSGLLCSRPELLDSYVYRSQSTPATGDFESVLVYLSEKKLLSELIDGAEFLQDLNLHKLICHQTETADDLVLKLLSAVQQPVQLGIVSLGKWGGQEMGLRSDLDFIFVTEHEPTENDMRGARKFFNALTVAHHRSGALYSVDLRLKPSGKGGLIVTSKDKLLNYLSHEAPAWERQAYLRARSQCQFLNRNEILQACFTRPLQSADWIELKEIRQKLLKPREAQALDIKYVEGGMVDIEFAVQLAILKSQLTLEYSDTVSMLDRMAWHSLSAIYQQLRKIEQMWQLLNISSTQKLLWSDPSFAQLSQMLGLETEAAQKMLCKLLDDSQHLLKRLDPRMLIE